MASPHPQYQNQGYMPNGTSGPAPGAQPLLPNQGRIIQSGPTRVLCIADVRGNLRSLNELAKTANASYILHTGDFGFYDDTSLERIAEKTLKHVAQYSPLILPVVKQQIAAQPQGRSIKQSFQSQDLPLSELPQLLNGQFRLEVPVYTVWGACEDVRVLEKFRSGEYKVENLHIIDEVNSRLLDVGGVKLRLLGLGGAVVIHKLFDNGEGKTYIAGGQGTMWTTLLQIGALIDTASRVYDPSETRIFLTHASPARDGILNQLSVTLKADFSISAGLHFRYGSSYNEFSVNPSLDHYRGKLAASKASFSDVWETVKQDVESAIASNENHKTLLSSALEIIEKMPVTANGGNPFGGPVGGAPGSGQVDESAFKNMWNFNLADAAFGYLVLEIDGGRIGTEMRAQGFNFAHRSGKPGMPVQPQSTQQAAAPPPANVAPQYPVAPAAVPTGPAQSRTPSFPAPAPAFPQQQRARPVPNTQQNTTPAATSATPPVAQSPAPPASQAKPMTPQPSSTNIPTSSTPVSNKPATPATNGASTSAGAGAGKTSDSEAAKPKPPTPAAERKPVTALYVMFADDEDQVKQCIAEEDRDKIKSINKQGHKFNNYTINFETHDIANAAFERATSQALSVKNSQGKSPKVSWFEDRRTFHREGHGHTSSVAGNWGSSRGAANAGTNNPARGGYQSGGASDSEGGRGRGAFRGRGRAQERGRGGRGGGRGNYQKQGADGTSDSKPSDGKPSESKPAESS